MTPILDSSFASALGWALIHSLWQCAAVGFLAWASLRSLRHRGPQARYLLGCGALTLTLALPTATLFALWTPVSLGSASGLEEGEVALLLVRSAALPGHGALQPFLPWLIAAWTAGVTVMSLRLAGGWLWIQRLRWLGMEPVEAPWQTRMEGLVERLGVSRPVRLAKSIAVEVPMVLGWFRPLILMPVAIFSAMEPQALAAILAHELAHVRRHDYLVNLLQSAVEVLLFFHPAVWWLSAQIRCERENCCDDIAVNLCGDPLLYARALAALEELRPTLETNPSLALAATGGTLMNRIRRIITPKLPPSPAARAGLIAAMAVSILGAASTFGFHPQETAPKPEPKKELREEKKIVTIVVDEDAKTPRKLKIEMKGKLKLQPETQPPVALEDGARLHIEGKDGEQLRSYLAERSSGIEKRIWTLDGKDLLPDAQAEAWLKKSLEAAQMFQFRVDEDGLPRVHRTLRWKMQDPKAGKELEAHAKLLEEKAKALAEKRMTKGTSETDLVRLQEEVAKQAKEVAAQARKLADRQIREVDQERIKVIVEEAKAEAEHTRQLADGARKERKKIIVLRTGKDGEPRPLEEKECLDREIMILSSQDKDPKLEIEALKKAIGQMQKRLDRLQKDAGKPAK